MRAITSCPMFFLARGSQRLNRTVPKAPRVSMAHRLAGRFRALEFLISNQVADADGPARVAWPIASVIAHLNSLIEIQLGQAGDWRRDYPPVKSGCGSPGS